MPDGATAPYIYWTVKDASGNAVGGSTFSFERYESGWTGTRSVTDCLTGTCAVVDRDNDPGDFLVKWIYSNTPGATPTATGATNTIQNGGRYRIRPVNPPAGYRWVSSTAWVDLTMPSASQTQSFGDFVVEKIYTPTCAAGFVYAISGTGQMQQIAPGGATTNMGTSAASVTYFNSLGIGALGQPVYAISRTIGNDPANENATVYRYDSSTGVWTSTGVSTAGVGGSSDTNSYLVAGAVNLATGIYYFGGYTVGGETFKIYEYNPVSNTVVRKASVAIAGGAPSSNGDMAFDGLGNLLIIRGVDTTVTVFSVTAADLQASSGGSTITPAVSAVTSIEDVNGVALDSSGKGYLGAGGQLNSYDTPGWTGANTVASGLSTTDLASCSAPGSVTVEKSIEGSRVAASDQFTLTLQKSGTAIATTTTTGSAVGVQSRRIGPLPAAPGAVLTFTETASGMANLNQYASAYRCFLDGVQISQGSATSGSVTIPASGQSVVCRFYNAPLKAAVKVHKDLADVNGQNPTSSQGWTVGATAVQTTGTVTKAPAANTQTTDASGNTLWTLTFLSTASRATLTVGETQQTGYQFGSGQCVVSHLDGTAATTALTGEAGKALAGIRPGDAVECGYVNSQIPGAISWEKRSNDTPAVNLAGSKWSLNGPGASGPTVAVDDCVAATAAGCATVLDKDNRGGFLKVAGLAWGAYTVTETSPPTGFVAPAAPNNSWTVTLSAANVQAGVTFGPVINSHIVGTATWSTVDVGNASPLSGSEWTLTGPSYPSGATVVDCVAATASACTGADKNPAAGAFTVVSLTYGSYSLIQTKAPAGFQVGAAPPPFLIDTDGQAFPVGPITNKRWIAPALPLTGGSSTDSFLITGAALIAVAGMAGWLHRRRLLRSS